jgi:hypothetical protein
MNYWIGYQNMKNKIILTALLLLIPAITTQAFAVTSVFDVDVRDYDPKHQYKACMTGEGSTPRPEECMDFKGSEFAGYLASFEYEDINVGDGFVVYLEDTTSHTVVGKTFDNT